MENLYLIILAGIIAVVYSYFLSNQIISSSPGNSKMQEIAEAIQIGAKAYLNRQYKTIAIVGVVVLIIISYFFSLLVGLGYLIGALLSGVAGYVGMLISVKANVRTAEASRKSLQSGLTSHISISFGALGLLALLDRFDDETIPFDLRKYIQVGVILYSIAYGALGVIDYYNSIQSIKNDKKLKLSQWDDTISEIYVILGSIMVSILIIISWFIITTN